VTAAASDVYAKHANQIVYSGSELLPGSLSDCCGLFECISLGLPAPPWVALLCFTGWLTLGLADLLAVCFCDCPPLWLTACLLTASLPDCLSGWLSVWLLLAV
jgi:hypothetical protein